MQQHREFEDNIKTIMCECGKLNHYMNTECKNCGKEMVDDDNAQ